MVLHTPLKGLAKKSSMCMYSEPDLTLPRFSGRGMSRRSVWRLESWDLGSLLIYVIGGRTTAIHAICISGVNFGGLVEKLSIVADPGPGDFVDRLLYTWTFTLSGSTIRQKTWLEKWIMHHLLLWSETGFVAYYFIYDTTSTSLNGTCQK